MTTTKQLREYCEKLYVSRKEELQVVLNSYFMSTFINAHKPWTAVIGNKKCKPVPIHLDFHSPEQIPKNSESSYFKWKFRWPNMSEELIRKELSNLGFVITENYISISVPPCEKGKNLTFAQEWVKKINYANEKKKANKLYEEFISCLLSTPEENVRTFDEYTLFCGFRSDKEVSCLCAKHIMKLMALDGIEEYYKNSVYIGVKVLRKVTN